MNKSLILIFCACSILTFPGVAQPANTKTNTSVIISTEYGDIKLQLYDETILHKENFLKLVNEGYYNGLLFHRLIKDFMIQGGDPNSKNAVRGERLGQGGPEYTIPAEIIPGYFHKKGALAAARKGNNVNPQKASSGSQFYIVQGKVFTEAQLEEMVSLKIHLPFSQKEKETYLQSGGSPHLDGEYTVFGEIIEGLEVFEMLMQMPVDANDRPLTDIRFSIKISR